MYNYRVLVTRVVDGDTFEGTVDLGFYVKTEQTFRLLGVDTPEIFHPKSKEEKELGMRAKEFVQNVMLGKTVEIISRKTGKYGRWLALVTVDYNGRKEDLAELLIEQKLTKADVKILTE